MLDFGPNSRRAKRVCSAVARAMSTRAELVLHVTPALDLTLDLTLVLSPGFCPIAAKLRLTRLRCPSFALKRPL
jgi:hypothetical protein